MMTKIRRILLAFACAIPLVALAYPDKPIEWVVPYPAGGGTDVIARILADQMSKTLGQNIIVNNKPGAATNLGAEYTAHAKPDGYTMLTGDTATLAANPSMYSKLNYSAEKDFASIGLIARIPMILVVNSKLPIKNYAEFIAWAKSQGDLTFASSGSGTPHHLTGELFGKLTGLKLVHVPYRGGAPAIQDVAGGQVPFMFIDSPNGLPFVQSGRVRAIGTASAKRVIGYENVPTLEEQGLKDFEAYAWQGLVFPTGTPAPIIEKVNKALVDALNTATTKTKLEALGIEGLPGTPQEMTSYVNSERQRWSRIIKANNIHAD